MAEKTTFLSCFWAASAEAPASLFDAMRFQLNPPWPHDKLIQAYLARPDLLEQTKALFQQRELASEEWSRKYLTCDKYFEHYPTLSPEFYIFWFKEGDYYIGNGKYMRTPAPLLQVLCDTSMSQELRTAVAHQMPFRWPRSMWKAQGQKYAPVYLFGNRLWSVTPQEMLLSMDELRLVLLEKIDSDREKFERLRRKFDRLEGKPNVKREPIPEEVRIFVWRRDQGKCVKCGSVERLEFDHIVPVIKGGSSTERNVELLCEACNRSKGAKLG
jgi:hypothetical protein